MKPICVTAQTLFAPRWRTLIEGKYQIADSGCWEWTATIDRYGYGLVNLKIGLRRRQTGAHRVSWIAHRGPILGNLELDHLCRNRKCINPFHLEPVTTQENTRRAKDAGSYDGCGGGQPVIPLEDRPGCGKHGKDSGKWGKRSNGRKVYDQWMCSICTSERNRRAHQRRKNLAPAP